MADVNEVAKKVLAELDVVKTWFAQGSAKHLKLAGLADELAEAVGGRPQRDTTDVANLATPGPGVRSETVATPVEVDSVGSVADTPAKPPLGALGQSDPKAQTGSSVPPP